MDDDSDNSKQRAKTLINSLFIVLISLLVTGAELISGNYLTQTIKTERKVLDFELTHHRYNISHRTQNEDVRAFSNLNFSHSNISLFLSQKIEAKIVFSLNSLKKENFQSNNIKYCNLRI